MFVTAKRILAAVAALPLLVSLAGTAQVGKLARKQSTLSTWHSMCMAKLRLRTGQSPAPRRRPPR
jgi:hypothetical protein